MTTSRKLTAVAALGLAAFLAIHAPAFRADTAPVGSAAPAFTLDGPDSGPYEGTPAGLRTRPAGATRY